MDYQTAINNSKLITHITKTVYQFEIRNTQERGGEMINIYTVLIYTKLLSNVSKLLHPNQWIMFHLFLGSFNLFDDHIIIDNLCQNDLNKINYAKI